jgi:beta-lactamase regulating signal transducer with metallopeptidase domain
MVAVDAVANWLWQGSVVALVATALLHGAPRVSATARYWLWWIALAIVLLLPMASSLQSLGAATAQPPSAGVMSGMQGTTVRIPALPWWAATLVAAIWTGWAAASLGRALLALASLRRARRACRAFPNEREGGLKTWNVLCRFGRRATLVVSDDVGTAAVLGLASPVIAVAPGVLRELRDDDLDRILVHEWAHVQRGDDVGRVVQVVVRVIAGLHPAVWWIDRQIHLDRETACDDWAVNLTGSARDYAACLTRLAALRLEQRESFLVPAAVFSSDLARRVARLLDRRRSTSTRTALAPIAVLAPMIAAVAVLIASVELTWGSAPHPGSVACGDPCAPRLSLAGAPCGPKPCLHGERDTFVHILAVQARLVVTGAPPVHPMGELGGLSGPAPTVPTVLRGIPPEAMQRIASVPGLGRQPSPGTSRAVESLQASLPVTHAEPQKPAEMTAPPQPGMGLQQPLPVGTPDTLALPGIRTPISESVALPAPKAGDRDPSTAAKVATPWGAAAEAGVGVGRGSQKAAVATAGFFSKLTKSIAGVF